MTPFELILLFLVGGMSIQAILTDDRSFTNALLGICTVASMHVLVSLLKQRSVIMRKIVDGTPLVIVDHGEWKTDLMVKANVLQEDVMAAARQKGVHRLAEIQFAIVERNGQISIFEKS
jgi:uncharacterized membrane protein YcaP (DUF421 family)